MYLSEISHSIIAVSDSAAATTEPKFWVSFIDIGTDDFAPVANAGVFTGTTDVELVPAPIAGLTRQIKHVAIYNADSVARAITVKLLDDFVERVLGIFPLAAGETLEYTQEHGWKIYPLPVAGTFLALTDVPSSFSGQGGKVLAVNGGESAVEFVTPTGIPSGGTTGQVLAKQSAADFDVDWDTPSGGGGAVTRFAWERAAGTVPQSSAFTARNPGTGGTLVVSDGTYSMDIFASDDGANAQAKMLNQSVPDTSVEVIAKIPAMARSNYADIGIGLYRTDTTACIGFRRTFRTTSGANSAFVADYYPTIVSTSTTGLLSPTSFSWDQVEWMKISCDGTTITFSISIDGRNWRVVATETLATRLVTFNEAGILLNAGNPGDLYANVVHFEINDI